ncbi:unnamed protein product [Clonostachys solani]|uniref:Uncharacterized protein n=1 Tax=Clonostachys solani TaxID=160281 RepID=A0A9N9ZHD1_9HYPO|nr:unnamed protein product [Clonostachys solani]
MDEETFADNRFRSNTEVGENNFDLNNWNFRYETSEFNQPANNLFYDHIDNISLEPVQLVAEQPVGQGQDFDIANVDNILLDLPQLRQESYTREVDSYQIAVPNGDCSIHLLVQRPPDYDYQSDRQKPAGTILRAVLMDGGNSGGRGVKTCAEILARAIKIIRSHYNNANMPQEVIQFDSWVITHWDGDHWGGALYMLENSPIGNNAQTTKYFKYDENSNPLTTLYCPNWTQPATFLTHAGVPLPKSSHIKQRPKNLCMKNEENAELSNQGIVYLSSKPGGHFGGFCRAKWGHRKLLGIDYFTGEMCYTPSLISDNGDSSFEVALNMTLSFFSHLQELTARIYRERYDHPRFFCIGAAGFVLGGDLSESAIRQAFGQERSSPSDTWANFSSLMSVLHFPQQKHVSLYWAGDAVSTMEMNFVADRTHAEGHFFDGYQFSVAKWSHHGSRHSSPLALWKKLQPQRYVVSPNKNGTYTHPHPNIIEQLRAHGNASRRLFSTFYPGWFKKPKAYVNLAMSDAVREVQKQRIEALTEGEAIQFLPAILQRVNYLEEIWGQICSAQADGIDGPAYLINDHGGTDHRDYITPKRGDTYQNLFIHILSSHNRDRDGFMKYYTDVRKLQKQEEQDEQVLENVHEQQDDIIFNVDDYVRNFDMLEFNGMNLDGITSKLDKNTHVNQGQRLYQTAFNGYNQHYNPFIKITGPGLD